jgi:hypothetical protein
VTADRHRPRQRDTCCERQEHQDGKRERTGAQPFLPHAPAFEAVLVEPVDDDREWHGCSHEPEGRIDEHEEFDRHGENVGFSAGVDSTASEPRGLDGEARHALREGSTIVACLN